jgi:hypothetical protein
MEGQVMHHAGRSIARFDFGFKAFRRPGKAFVVVARDILGATVILTDCSTGPEISVSSGFEALAGSLLRHPSLAGAAPAMVRWIEHMPEFEHRGRRIPESFFEIKTRWDEKARRYCDSRWLPARDSAVLRAMLEACDEPLAA